MELLLRAALTRFAGELERLLLDGGHTDLAKQVPELKIVGRCRCGDDFCSTFYTQPKPKGRYGAGHKNVEVFPEQGMIILDVVKSRIMCVEVLYRTDVQRELFAVMPWFAHSCIRHKNPRKKP
jgi:hypothetical protein